MNVVTKTLTRLTKDHGELAKVAKICGVTHGALDRWKRLGRFPRTDFTGETNYAERIAKLSGHSREELLAASSRWWKKNGRNCR